MVIFYMKYYSAIQKTSLSDVEFLNMFVDFMHNYLAVMSELFLSC